MRRCQTCGAKVAAFTPRQRNPRTGSLECKACRNHQPKVAARGFTVLAEHTWGEGPDGDLLLPPGRYRVAAVDDSGTWVEHEGQKLILGEARVASEDYPMLSEILVERPPLESVTSAKRVAHDAGEGAAIAHCPFCGSGNVIGRSDGSIECGYCPATFTVQVQPEHPNMPQTVGGEPYDIPGMTGEIDPAEVGDTIEDDPDDESGDDDAETKEARRFITRDGIALAESDYIEHLARRFSQG